MVGQCLVGYSGHERGYHVPIAAVARGAKIIENGSAIKWADGSNTLKVNVVAEDGTTKKAYTITVTKS